MTSQLPDIPAFFPGNQARRPLKDQLQGVLPEDRTWFNRYGGNIIQTNYNKCTRQVQSIDSSFNVPPCLSDTNLWPCARYQIPNAFWQYGLAPSCDCDLNRCGCSNCHQKKRCALYEIERYLPFTTYKMSNRKENEVIKIGSKVYMFPRLPYEIDKVYFARRMFLMKAAPKSKKQFQEVSTLSMVWADMRFLGCSYSPELTKAVQKAVMK